MARTFVLLFALALRCAEAFPSSVAANGSVSIETAFGGNLVLQPDKGGA